MEGSGVISTGKPRRFEGAPMTPTTEYREIFLTKGCVAKVDVFRFEELNAFKWYAHLSPNTGKYYAARRVTLPNHKTFIYFMHRQIIGLWFGDKRQADHIDHDSLNNLSANLRIASPSENRRNSLRTRANTSGFKGVTRSRNGWQAQIGINGRHIYLGYRATAEQAFELYKTAADRLHGDFACYKNVDEGMN